MPRRRHQPNIIITGTPGVGKTTHCEQLAAITGLKHLCINEVVKERECHEGWDEEYRSWIVDEDKLLDALEDEVAPSSPSGGGGYILDWHACDLFPRSWIDLVVVLRTDTTTLYDRLKRRNYAEKKLQENLDAEIMKVLLEEARDAFDEEIVVEMNSDEAEHVDENVRRIQQWIEAWKRDREGEEEEEKKEEGAEK
ncbi:MAG: hypothetical protein Q9163_001966 [Psora crenata]